MWRCNEQVPKDPWPSLRTPGSPVDSDAVLPLGWTISLSRRVKQQVGVKHAFYKACLLLFTFPLSPGFQGKMMNQSQSRHSTLDLSQSVEKRVQRGGVGRGKMGQSFGFPSLQSREIRGDILQGPFSYFSSQGSTHQPCVLSMQVFEYVICICKEKLVRDIDWLDCPLRQFPHGVKSASSENSVQNSSLVPSSVLLEYLFLTNFFRPSSHPFLLWSFFACHNSYDSSFNSCTRQTCAKCSMVIKSMDLV